MLRWLFAHPWGWFLAVVTAWCFSMGVIALFSGSVRRLDDDDDDPDLGDV